ncbi:MAG: hypothetical protein R2757_12285 [Draconibacterium sp.]
MYDLIRGRLPGVQIVGNEIIIRGLIDNQQQFRLNCGGWYRYAK